MRVHDPRISTELVMLDEAHNKLIEADRAFSERCFVRRFARQIKESLVGLHNRPKKSPVVSVSTRSSSPWKAPPRHVSLGQSTRTGRSVP